MSSPRLIPPVDALLQRQAIVAISATYGADPTRQAVRLSAERLRAAILRDDANLPQSAEAAGQWIDRDVDARLAARFRGSLRRVINATGVILHTNLGRAPLAASAIERLSATARGYTNLEYDLATGQRGSRAVHAESLIAALSGAEAALVVNNNAAATLLMLAALAQGREVLISRGELVEIGGGFRVPDVMAQSGAILREVGTTNRTRVSDYTASAGPKTALILRVHPSNFRIEGFVERPDLPALVEAGRTLGIPVVEDLGSGHLAGDLADEPSVSASIESGASLVCFSGDKLLGGPQAGILAGRRTVVDTMARHPLMRALRADKLTYAALEGTLLEYLAGRARETVPVQQMLHAGTETIETRARELASRLHEGGWQVQLVSGFSAVGGGSAPGVQLPTVLVAIARESHSPSAIEAWLRGRPTPVIARIVDERVVLDLRTVPEDTVDELVSALHWAADADK